VHLVTPLGLFSAIIALMFVSYTQHIARYKSSNSSTASSQLSVRYKSS